MDFSKWLRGIDLTLLIPVLVLVTISLVTLLSVNQSFFRSQLLFSILSLGAFMVFSQINPNVLRHYSVPIYLISIALLTIVLFLGIESRGAVRWIELGGFRIQFSEILKPFLAISFASYLTSEDHSLRRFLSIFILLFPIAFLIFAQPDLGNALIYFISVGFTLLVFGFSLRYFITGGLIGLLSLPFFWLILHDYQKQRVLAFLNPSADPLGTSYNAIQSTIAVGSGNLVGKGLGQATQSALNFLPENHTDFIFANISESLGLIGSIIVLGAFAFLLYRMFSMLKEGNSFTRNFTLVAIAILFTHFFINIGMNVGLIPVVGVTLPFVSYGGSSLLSNFIILGIVAGVNRSKEERDFLEIG